MKSNLKRLVIVFAASSLVASGIALAEQAKGRVSPGTEGPAYQQPTADDWAEFMAFKLEKLHTALKLNPTQETAWKEWSGKINAERSGWKERRKEFETGGNLPVPERMEKMLAFAKERVGKLEERLAATKAFYATLSPEQRQVFDKEFTFGPHGHAGKYRKE
jgi:Ni/Co efflux regulator RcnB